MASGPITSRQIGGGKNGNSDRLYFLGLQNHCRWLLQPWNYGVLKDRDIADKGPSSQSYGFSPGEYPGTEEPGGLQSVGSQRVGRDWATKHSTARGFSSSHEWMWELDHKKGWATKNWCFWTMVLEKTLESPLDCKENKPVSPKGDQSWIFIGRTDAEAEAPILWPSDGKSRLTEKDPDAEKDWRQRRMRWQRMS